MRADFATLEDNYKGLIANHMLEYEDLRTSASHDYQRMEEYKDEVSQLKDDLSEMTRFRNEI